MKVKAVFSDFDDTLCNTRKLYDDALNVCHKLFNEKTTYNFSFEKFTELYEKAKRETHALVPTAAASHNRAIYFQKIFEDMQEQTDYGLVYQLYETYYNYIYSNVKPYPHAIDLIRWIKQSHRKFVLVSDGSTHTRIQTLYAAGLAHYVDYIVTSEEVGMEKPSTQMFLVALNKAKVDPDEVLFMGNSSKRDIYGAELANIETIWVNINKNPKDYPTSKEEKADHVVTDLSEVRPIIEKLEETNKF